MSSSVQQLSCFAVSEVVEASPERIPSSAMVRCEAPTMPVQQTDDVAAGLLDGLRIEPLEDAGQVWAGARFQRRPKAVFSRRRCTVMKVSMERWELPPVTTARIENSRT